MFSPAIIKREIVYKKLNIKQDLFCKIFATDPEIMGNASQAYLKAYGGNYNTAMVAGKKFLDKPEITARINEYLSNEGFNNENVDKQTLFVINQHRDLHAKMKGIGEYNKLKKRIDNTLTIIAPKPIMELEDDEVVVKIDKSKAIEVEGG